MERERRRGGRERGSERAERDQGERVGDLLSWASCNFFLSSSRSGSVGLRLPHCRPPHRTQPQHWHMYAALPEWHNGI